MAATNWQAQLRASLNTNRPRRSKREDRKRSRKPKSKPAWDDKSSDLTAYKPSPKELLMSICAFTRESSSLRANSAGKHSRIQAIDTRIRKYTNNTRPA
eukprot:gene8118-8987_t